MSAPAGFTLRHTLQGHEDIVVWVTWSPDGKYLASCSADETIRIWDAQSGLMLKIFRAHRDVVLCLSWSPDGALLASASDDRTVRIWNSYSGETKQTLEGGLVNDLAWSPNGSILTSGSDDGIIRWWNTGTWKEEKSFAAHASAVSGVAWSGDGKILASCSSDKTVKLWDGQTGEQIFSTIRGHSARVFDLAWTPDAKRLVTGSEDATVRVWDVQTGRAVAVLEGHTNWVTCVRVSPDGEVIATKSDDDTVRLWATNTGECLGVLSEPKSRHWITGIAFHPNGTLLATLGEKDQIIRLWELDYPILFGNIKASAQYSTAKVVIVGEQAVGKSALALVLSGQPFQATESTHGRHIRTLTSERIKSRREVEVFREVILWDLPGESSSTLIQHSHLNDVAVALVVFDASRGGDSLAGITQWVRALRQARLDQGTSTEGLKMFLVATRSDRSLLSESARYRARTYMKEFGFDLFFETSAATGQNIAALRRSILDAIDWNAIPAVSSTVLFQRIKAFLMEEKEANRLLSTQEDLYRAFLSWDTLLHANKNLFREFETCVGLVESRGLIQVLSFGKYILLQPELLDSYAAAILNAASYDRTGEGIFYEEDLTSPRIKPQYFKLRDPEQEGILLTTALVGFLRNEIAFRDIASGPVRYVFPSQAVRDFPGVPEEPSHAVSFSFEGAVLTIYSTLAVRLANSGVFQMRGVWKKGISYSVKSNGQYGLILRERGEGTAELVVFFDLTAENEVRLQFQEYVHTHLKRHALPGSVKRKRAFVCATCGTPVSNLQVERRLARGIDWIACNVCDSRVSLIDDQISTASGSAVVEIDQGANLQRDRQVAAMIVHGKTTTRDYDVYLSFAPQDRSFVRHVAGKLKEAGILPWFDEDLHPGIPWQQVLEKDLPDITTVLLFVGEGAPWEHFEFNSVIRDFVSRKARLIAILLPQSKRSSLKVPSFAGAVDAEWIDFHKQNRDPMRQLIATLTNQRALHPEHTVDASITALKGDVDDSLARVDDKKREIDLAMKRSDWATAHQLLLEAGELLRTINRPKDASVFTLQALEIADDPLKLNGKGLREPLELLADSTRPKRIEKWITQCKHRTLALSELRLIAASGREHLWTTIRNSTIEPWAKWFQSPLPNINQITSLPREGHGWPAIRLMRLRLENIKGFHSLKLDFREQSEKQSMPRMCSAIVGDNATGKSTLLQCIALGSLGHSLANQTDIRALSLLRHGATKGAIELEFEITVDSNASPHESVAVAVGLELDHLEEDFRALPNNRMTFGKLNCVEHWSALRRQVDFHWGFCCGYGAFRGLRERTDKTSTPMVLKSEIDRVLSLFQPHSTLMDPTTLEALLQADVSSFSLEQKTIPLGISDEILGMLQAVIPGMEIEERQGKRTLIEKHSRVCTLASLSDGPNSMIGLLGHLIRHSLEIQGWLRKNENGIGTSSPSSPLKVAGIVLIDEVDLHLHPSWQRLALSQLQDAFPNLQVIVTTHSPLVLGGIPDGKVTVLRRDEEGKVVVLKDEPSVKGWRVDQLLTGVHFDVPSSYDTTTERLITRYAKLLNEKGSNDPAVREAAKEIKDIKPPEHTGAELEIKAWNLLKELTLAKVEKMSSSERERLLSSLQESKNQL